MTPKALIQIKIVLALALVLLLGTFVGLAGLEGDVSEGAGQPRSIAYVGIAVMGPYDYIYTLRNDGLTNFTNSKGIKGWHTYGTGTPSLPAGTYAGISVGVGATAGYAYLLKDDGTVYFAAGGVKGWVQYGNATAPGTGYVGIASGSSDTSGYVYILKDDGTVYYISGGIKGWVQYGSSSAPSTGYVSIACGRDETSGYVYVLRSDGTVYYTASGIKGWVQYGSSAASGTGFVGIACGSGATSGYLYILRSDGTVNFTNSGVGAWYAYGTGTPSLPAGTYADIAAGSGSTAGYVYVLRNDANVYFISSGVKGWTQIPSALPSANLAPTASFTYTPSSPTTADTVQFTDTSTDSDGTIVAWSWQFGDGATDTSQNATHQYSANGTYPVNLTVTDDDAATDTIQKNVTVGNVTNAAPTASFTYSPSSPIAMDSVQFTDTSTDADGTIVAWAWEFGDGATATTQNTTHQYTNDGTYNVNLTVTDDGSAQDTHSEVIVVMANVSTIFADAGPNQTVSDGDIVQFNGTGSIGTNLTYSWDFDALDGISADSTEACPTRIYNISDRYLVTLTVSDGISTASDAMVVTVTRTVNLVCNSNNTGYNYISWSSGQATNASALAELIGNTTLPNGSFIAMYNTTTGLWMFYIVGVNSPNGPEDFTIATYGVVCIRVAAGGSFEIQP